MKTQLVGEAECLGEAVRYYLLEETTEQDADYGVCVEYRGEEVSIPHIDRSREHILALLEAMIQGAVTPVTARDIAEDWIEEQVIPMKFLRQKRA